MAEAQTTPFTGRTAWGRNLAAPVRDFLSTETGSAVVLLGAAVAALLWANSPWSDSYESLWTTTLSIQIGDSGISEPLRTWVNEGLMVLFFFVIGLEAKREFAMGELRAGFACLALAMHRTCSAEAPRWPHVPRFWRRGQRPRRNRVPPHRSLRL